MESWIKVSVGEKDTDEEEEETEEEKKAGEEPEWGCGNGALGHPLPPLPHPPRFQFQPSRRFHRRRPTWAVTKAVRTRQRRHCSLRTQSE